MKTWQLWWEDKTEISARLERGEDLEGYNSAFGENDLIMHKPPFRLKQNSKRRSVKL